jgi:NADPH-dependent ferric siderophore reductase
MIVQLPVERTAEALWHFADAAGLPVVAAALAMLPASHTPGFAEIADAVAQQSDPAAPTLARLLMALEHL